MSSRARPSSIGQPGVPLPVSARGGRRSRASAGQTLDRVDEGAPLEARGRRRRPRRALRERAQLGERFWAPANDHRVETATGSTEVELRREWRQGWMVSGTYGYQHAAYADSDFSDLPITAEKILV